MRPWVLLLAVLLAVPFGLATHGGPTLCHKSAPGPVVSGSGVLAMGQSAGHGIDDVLGLAVTVSVQGGPPSHGPFRWHMLDRATGTEWANGSIVEIYVPTFLGASPYDDLCLEIRNAGSLKEYSFVVEASNI